MLLHASEGYTPGSRSCSTARGVSPLPTCPASHPVSSALATPLPSSLASPLHDSLPRFPVYLGCHFFPPLLSKSPLASDPCQQELTATNPCPQEPQAISQHLAPLVLETAPSPLQPGVSAAPKHVPCCTPSLANANLVNCLSLNFERLHWTELLWGRDDPSLICLQRPAECLAD